MSRKITERDLRTRSGEIVRALERDETFILTRHGVPVGELRPLRQRHFVAVEDAVAIFAAAPAIDRSRFRDDVDAILDQEPTPLARPRD